MGRYREINLCARGRRARAGSAQGRVRSVGVSVRVGDRARVRGSARARTFVVQDLCRPRTFVLALTLDLALPLALALTPSLTLTARSRRVSSGPKGRPLPRGSAQDLTRSSKDLAAALRALAGCVYGVCTVPAGGFDDWPGARIDAAGSPGLAKRDWPGAIVVRAGSAARATAAGLGCAGWPYDG